MDYNVFGGKDRRNLTATLPARLAGALGLTRGSRVRWELAEKGRGLVLRPVRGPEKGPEG